MARRVVVLAAGFLKVVSLTVFSFAVTETWKGTGVSSFKFLY